LRNSFRYASRRDWPAIAKDLKPVYTAPTEREEFLDGGDTAVVGHVAVEVAGPVAKPLERLAPIEHVLVEMSRSASPERFLPVQLICHRSPPPSVGLEAR